MYYTGSYAVCQQVFYIFLRSGGKTAHIPLDTRPRALLYWPAYKYEMCDLQGGIRLAGGKHVLGMSKARHIFGTAKVGDRGQIVIPKDARELYGIKPGDTLLVLGDEENGMIVTKPEVLSELAAKILSQIGKEG